LSSRATIRGLRHLLKREIWEKWGATYGRNGWVGEKTQSENVLACDKSRRWVVTHGEMGVRLTHSRATATAWLRGE